MSGRKIGFIDKDGKFLINPQFEGASEDLGRYLINGSSNYEEAISDYRAPIDTTNTIQNAESTQSISVSKIESSGFLRSGKDVFSPEKAMDNNLKTWWTPNPKRDGVGTFITFYFENEVEINSMEILNGSHYPDYPKFGDIFKMNNRLKGATLSFSNGSKQTIQLQDIDAMQAITFTATKTTWVKISVDAIFPGSKWNDLCISEIKFNLIK